MDPVRQTADMTDAPVLLDVSDSVATITLNRPEAMNSLDVATKEALVDIVGRVAADPEVRCVVLTGSGRAFCVGQDLKEHIAILRSDSSEQLFRTVDEHYNPLVHTLATMPKPVVAAVNGVAAGAGASLAFACDVRIVAESAGFNLAFAGVALSCDTGSSWTLPRLVGQARALDLLLFPRTVGAAESLELGLANRVVPDDQVAAVAGDQCNYQIGRYFGPKVFGWEQSRFFNKAAFDRAHAFYERHGGITIIVARFLPFVRTFAPFVAGVAQMSYPKFALYNVTGATLWVVSLAGIGYLFGNTDWVKANFQWVTLAMIVIPGLPAVFEVLRHWLRSRRAREAA